MTFSGMDVHENPLLPKDVIILVSLSNVNRIKGHEDFFKKFVEEKWVGIIKNLEV